MKTLECSIKKEVNAIRKNYLIKKNKLYESETKQVRHIVKIKLQNSVRAFRTL